jgi:hypothetical protein
MRYKYIINIFFYINIIKVITKAKRVKKGKQELKFNLIKEKNLKDSKLYFNKYNIFIKREYIYNKEFNIYKYVNKVKLNFEKVFIILKFIKQIKEGTSNSSFIK